jgi:uncharacterized protein YkwD
MNRGRCATFHHSKEIGMKRWFAIITIIMAGTVAPSAAQDKKEFKLTEDEQTLLDLTNAERKNKELAPLTMNQMLVEVARAHSANMAKQQKMEHDLDGKTPYDRIKAAGYKYSLGGENIARGLKLPIKSIMELWMKSKVHRENILEPKFTEIGVGIARNDKGEVYYTQVFATPRK